MGQNKTCSTVVSKISSNNFFICRYMEKKKRNPFLVRPRTDGYLPAPATTIFIFGKSIIDLP